MSAGVKEQASEALAKGNYAKAATLYEQHCAQQPQDLLSRVRLGDAWAQAGHKPEAIAAYRTAAEEFSKKGFLPRAMAAAKLILELDPANREMQQLLTRLHGERQTTRSFTPTQLPAVPAPAVSTSAPPAKEKMRFDELELDVEAAAQALWGGPRTSPVEGDSLMQAVERAAEVFLAQSGEKLEPETADEGSLDRLAQLPIFSDLDHATFVALFEKCPLRRVAKDERILTQGERGEAFYVVCAGSVRVVREEGGHERELARLGEGTFFGEMALLTGAPRAASVESNEDDTQLLEISTAVLTELAETSRGVVQALRRFARQRMLANVMESAPLFAGLSREERKALSVQFLSREFRAGEVVLTEGKPSDGLYVVLAGAVQVTRGGKPVAILREGDQFGGHALLNQGLADATVTVRGRSWLLRMASDAFESVTAVHPKIRALLSQIAESRKV
jgi:CRP-like cAMP-binding protein